MLPDPATPFRPDWRHHSDLPDAFNDLPEAEAERLHAERVRLLHVYGQRLWHMPVHLVGNRNALTVVRNVIDAALTRGEAETEVMATDGEGYHVKVEMDDRGWQHPAWETRPLPYTDPLVTGGPDLEADIRALRAALRAANAQLVKRGVRPIADTTREGSDDRG